MAAACGWWNVGINAIVRTRGDDASMRWRQGSGAAPPTHTGLVRACARHVAAGLAGRLGGDFSGLWHLNGSLDAPCTAWTLKHVLWLHFLCRVPLSFCRIPFLFALRGQAGVYGASPCPWHRQAQKRQHSDSKQVEAKQAQLLPKRWCGYGCGFGEKRLRKWEERGRLFGGQRWRRVSCCHFATATPPPMNDQ